MKIKTFDVMIMSSKKYSNNSSIIVFIIILIGFIRTSSLSISPLSNGPWGPTNPIADKKVTIIVSGEVDYNDDHYVQTNVRFTILTDRVIRIERCTCHIMKKDSDDVISVDEINNNNNENNNNSNRNKKKNNNKATINTTTTTDTPLCCIFEDRKTIAIINRKLPVPQYQYNIHTDMNINYEIITIQTKCITLKYHIGQIFTNETLQVSGVMYCDDNNTNGNKETSATPTPIAGKEDSASKYSYHNYLDDHLSNMTTWKYQYGTDDPDNLLGTIRTLDFQDNVTLNCTLTANPISDHCEWGLISRTGYSILNDINDYALSNNEDWWDGPNYDTDNDFYIFGHGHDYNGALYDYQLLGGHIPMLPRYAFGVWYTRWYDYTTDSAAKVLKDYEWYNIPLDVFILDMNWHTKNDWTGYSYDKRLFGNNVNDAVSYMKYRNVAVSMNIHDANGVHIWEDRYNDMCDATQCNVGQSINFSIINQTIAYALEDYVLQPLEITNGIDFWWIDWQQNEVGPGGAIGGKHNPTIWTAHIRSTNANRHRQQQHSNRLSSLSKKDNDEKITKDEEEITNRSMVLARWGGLGSHRYPVHFSGDVLHLSWNNLAFQIYFSLTGTNVGAIWSHDIEGPSNDLELYTRWLQWGVISGIMRSHDRGMSTGGCAATATRESRGTCSIVVPWNVPPIYAQANVKALRLRGNYIPYLYTAAYNAHKTGRWYTTPMYYQWPELDGAYETATSRPDINAKYDLQYMFGDDIMAVPVTKPSNASDGLTVMSIWIPPGNWVGIDNGRVLRGNNDGSSSVTINVDLDDIPLFAKAGSVIPTIPVRPGATIGLARKSFDEIIWTIYLASGSPISGSGVVYEDDGTTTAYYVKDSFTITTASYHITTSEWTDTPLPVDADTARHLMKSSNDSPKHGQRPKTKALVKITISTKGHIERVSQHRANTIRLVNMLPPDSVIANGVPIPFHRFGGIGTWAYQSKDAAVVIELAPVSLEHDIQMTIQSTCTSFEDEMNLLEGFGYKLQRAIAAKETLDELWITPGSNTGEDKLPAYLMRSASYGSSLEYAAGNPSSVRDEQFDNQLALYQSIFIGAVHEVQTLMDNYNKDDRILPHITRALALLTTAL